MSTKPDTDSPSTLLESCGFHIAELTWNARPKRR
jgi:hypothetical protein